MTRQSAPPPSFLDTLRQKLGSLVPQPVKERFHKLTPSQQQYIVFGTIGLFAFIGVWSLFSAMMASHFTLGPRQHQTVDNGVSTAIVQPKQQFPDSKPVAAVVKQNPWESLKLSEAQRNQLLRLRQSVNNEYRNALSFPLDEAKMIAFAQAATKIDMVNNKWDTLIAGAPTDKMANEYLATATLESRQILLDSIDVTEQEYSEIYDLSTHDKRFNEVANAYKKLVTDGIWGPVSPNVANSKVMAVDPSSVFPVRQTIKPAGTSNPATPGASGTAPGPAH